MDFSANEIGRTKQSALEEYKILFMQKRKIFDYESHEHTQLESGCL